MTVLTEREFWMHRRSFKKKTVAPNIGPRWIITIALAVASLGAAALEFGSAKADPQPAPMAGFFMLG
jgi:hypothetical protein